MANSKKSTKGTQAGAEDTQQADAAPQVEVSGAWTVVEETVVDAEKELKESNVVHIENVDVEDEGSSSSDMLFRHPSEKMVGGVCAGLAHSLGWDPTLIRILWVGATLATFGGGVAAYLAFWLLLPSGTPEDGVVTPATISLNRRNSSRLSYAFIGIGALILLSNIGLLSGLAGGVWAVLGIAFWPAVMIGIGYMLLDRSGETDWRQSVRDARSSMEARFQNKVDADAVRSNFGKVRSSLPLRRSGADRMVMGVCGGLSRKVGIDANLIRFGWIALTFISGIFPGVVAYVALGLLLPEEGVMNTSSETRKTHQRRQEVQDVQIL